LHSPLNSNIEVSNNHSDSQPLKRFSDPRKRTLFPRPTGPAAEWLKLTAMAFDDGDLIRAQRFYEAILAAREEWLRVMNRRLPSEEQLDRERYAPRRREYAK
ncbi:MAG: hypothetical protein AB7L36_01340, partial [Sphingomonadaceae bacterium]